MRESLRGLSSNIYKTRKMTRLFVAALNNSEFLWENYGECDHLKKGPCLVKLYILQVDLLAGKVDFLILSF